MTNKVLFVLLFAASCAEVGDSQPPQHGGPGAGYYGLRRCTREEAERTRCDGMTELDDGKRCYCSWEDD